MFEWEWLSHAAQDAQRRSINDILIKVELHWLGFQVVGRRGEREITRVVGYAELKHSQINLLIMAMDLIQAGLLS